MTKTKLLGFFIAILSLSSPLLAAAPRNPDPNYIKVLNGGKKVRLIPHGFDNNIPSQDTANLQWVLKNYSKSDIQLIEGTYHVSECIEGADYQGTISGEGQDKTFLVGRGPLVNGQYVFPSLNADLQARFYAPGAPFLFWFHPTDADPNTWQTNKLALGLEDLTIRVDGLGPLNYLFGQPIQCVWGLLAITGHDAPLPVATGNVSHIELDINNVTFLAQDTSYTLNGVPRFNANVSLGMIMFGGENWSQGGMMLNGRDETNHGPANVQINIHDTNYINFWNYAVAIEGTITTDTVNPATGYTVATNPPFPRSYTRIENCVFDNCGGGAGLFGGEGFNIVTLGVSGTDFYYQDNKFLNTPAMGLAFLGGLYEFMPKTTSNFYIRDNEFQHVTTPVSNTSLIILDTQYTGQAHYALNIQDNRFSSQTGYNASFVTIGMGTSAQITDNQFSGPAAGAISIGNTPAPFPPYQILPATYCFVRDNSFSSTAPSIADVILGPFGSFNTVIVDGNATVQNSGQGNTVIID